MTTQSWLSLLDDLVSGSSTTKATTEPHRKLDKPMKPPRRRPSSPAAGKPLSPLPLANNRIAQLVEQIEPTRHKDELILSPQTIRILAGLVEEYQRADTLRRHGLPVRSKLLFCGAPGCGKTVTAEVFARELSLPFFVARLDAIISSFLGETAANLRKLFEEVERYPAVLFLDEFDALARTRKEGAEHGELRRVVNSLLMLIDRYRGKGFIIAATNLDESLDAAVWRRFDEVILFEAPQDRQIKDLIRLKTRNFPLDFEIGDAFETLRGLSYADIERVCLNAIKSSILNGSPTISRKEFIAAVRDEQRRQDVRNRLFNQQ